MCFLQISVLFVFMRVEIYLFNSGIVGSCGVFLLVMFLCVILLRMGYDIIRSIFSSSPTLCTMYLLSIHHICHPLRLLEGNSMNIIYSR